MRGVGIVLFLVVLATVVATGARWWRVPAPSLLVVAGVVVGVLPGTPQVQVTPEAISLVVLPPLLYASAEELSLRELRAVWKPVAVLSVGLVLASAAAVAAVAAALTPLSPQMAFVLGAVLAPTDPVAVTALGRRLPLPPRVQMLVQSESLFNDATSLVLFKVAVAVTVASTGLSAPDVAGRFVLLAGGGVLIGTAVAGAVALIRRRTEDPVLETVIALVTPYGAYLLAESAHASGVTAVVVAGVLLGSGGHRLTDARIRLQLHAVYGTVVFLLESVVFAIIGLELPTMIRQLTGTDRLWPLDALAVAGTLVAMRALWVAPLGSAVRQDGRRGPSLRLSAVLCWAGTRGVVPLAAVLSIPLHDDNGAKLAGRPLVLVLATSVVVATLVAQGFTLAPLVRRSGIALEPERTEREEAQARTRLAEAGLRRLEELTGAEAVPEAVADRLRRAFQARIEHARGQLDGAAADPGESAAETYRQVRRDLIAEETAELRRLYDANLIGDTTLHRLQRMLDLEEARLADA